MYADDMNAYKEFPETTDNEEVLGETREGKEETHECRGPNTVTFDPKKESFHVVSRTKASGGDFKSLGVVFDGELTMDDHGEGSQEYCSRSSMETTHFRTKLKVPV